MLKNKNILLIAPKMFDYPVKIQKVLNGFGAKVTYFPERPYNLATRIIRNISDKLYKRISQKYLESILTTTAQQDIDYVIIIGSSIIDEFFLETLRKQQDSATFLTYQWDSNRLYPYFHLLPYFDKAFSFDPIDCEHNKILQYLPLFYAEEYKGLRNSTDKQKYDLLHIGSLHPERYMLIRKTENFCRQNNIRFYYYIYIPFSTYIKYLLKGVVLKNVKFLKLSQPDILSLYKKTKVVLDLPQSKQTGLTMRTFEVLGAHKKLITTNQRIRQEDIYSPDMVSFCNFNKKNLFDISFINNQKATMESWKEKIENYSLEKWVLHMLSR